MGLTSTFINVSSLSHSTLTSVYVCSVLIARRYLLIEADEFESRFLHILAL